MPGNDVAAIDAEIWRYSHKKRGAPPMSYRVNGRQFVAVATGAAAGPGGSGSAGVIRLFALPVQ